MYVKHCVNPWLLGMFVGGDGICDRTNFLREMKRGICGRKVFGRGEKWICGKRSFR